MFLRLINTRFYVNISKLNNLIIFLIVSEIFKKKQKKSPNNVRAFSYLQKIIVAYS